MRNWTIASRPAKNSERLRHTLSGVYANETRTGSRVFQASSAMRTFVAADSESKGGNGGLGFSGVLIINGGVRRLTMGAATPDQRRPGAARRTPSVGWRDSFGHGFFISGERTH